MDDLEDYAIIIIAIVAVIVLAVIVILVKKCRKRNHTKDELRTISTIQTAYFTPAQHPNNQNHAANTASGWNLTDLDQRSTGVNIQQPPAGAFIVPREPVVFTQYGYPPYPRQEPNNMPYPQDPSTLPYAPPYALQEPNTMHRQAYEKPPPYNPGL